MNNLFVWILQSILPRRYWYKIYIFALPTGKRMDVEIVYTNGEIERRNVRFYTRDKNRVMWFLTDNGWEHSFCVKTVNIVTKG